jgi:hypothetical protein
VVRRGNAWQCGRKKSLKGGRLQKKAPLPFCIGQVL